MKEIKVILREMPHAVYDREEEISSIDFQIEKMPISKDEKSDLLRAFHKGKGIIGKTKKGRILKFTPSGVKVLRGIPTDDVSLLPKDWQKYAKILKDGRTKMNHLELKEMIREMVREVISEKWEDDVEVKSTGEHADKTIAQLEKEMDAMVGTDKFDRDKYAELQFAWRAKKGWPDKGYTAKKKEK